eukprot:3121848-Rhodomonas_salina.2
MSGTDLGYASRRELRRESSGSDLRGTSPRYRPTRALCDVRYLHGRLVLILPAVRCIGTGIGLRVYYAMSGTDMDGGSRSARRRAQEAIMAMGRVRSRYAHPTPEILRAAQYWQ